MLKYHIPYVLIGLGSMLFFIEMVSLSSMMMHLFTKILVIPNFMHLLLGPQSYHTHTWLNGSFFADMLTSYFRDANKNLIMNTKPDTFAKIY